MALSRVSHDKFFKHMMKDLRVAKDFFTAHLPANFLQKLNLETLKIEDASFIDGALKAKHSDMLYQVKLENEQLAYLYLLVEHQSTSEPLMAFRLLYYIFQILDRHVGSYKNKSPLPLPLVYPLVFYNGKEVFSTKRDIFKLFGAQEALAREVFLKPFTLVDVSTMDDETLKGHHWAALMEWCMRHSIERDFLLHIKYLGELLRNLELKPGDSILAPMVKYIISGISALKEASETIEELRQQVPPDLENEIMTLAEQLYNNGKTEGERKTKEIIRQAIERLKRGYSLPVIAQETGLNLEYIESLRIVIEE